MSKIIDKIKNLFRKKVYVRYRYSNAKARYLSKIAQGDWIDLRACMVKVNGKDSFWIVDDYDTEPYVSYKKGDHLMIDTGISMQLPKGYEAYVLPRSSTYKNFHTLLTNSMGVIDNSYCGNDDIWYISMVALQDGFIRKDDRIAQFRIQKKMPSLKIVQVYDLGNKNRGGFGSTGTK